MHWLFFALMIAFPLLVFLIVPRAQAQPPATPPPATAPVTADKVQKLTQGELEKMLQRLETQAVPKPTMGAMCYKPAMPPTVTEYVCPKCNEKTLYPHQAFFLGRELPACRREFEKLKAAGSLAVSLDESSFCHHCSPDATKHELVLVITYPDGTLHKVSPVGSTDLVYLQNLLAGKPTYATFNDATQPLKKEIPRLRELLGLKPSDTAPAK